MKDYMTAQKPLPQGERKIKTGRRPNPTIDGPRDNTVCFMLSEGEKLTLDRLAFCLHLTRSGVLANIVSDFVRAAEKSKEGRAAEKRLLDYLKESRKAFQERGKFAAKVVLPPKGEEQP